MSFLLYDSSGNFYCDWRVNVAECESSWFFGNLMAFAITIDLSAFCLNSFCLLFRVRLLSKFSHD